MADILTLALVDDLQQRVERVTKLEGPPGKDGKDGKDGVDGATGPQGERGPMGPAGPAGKDGTDGKDGKDGEDGVSVVDARMDVDNHLVLVLSNGNEIDAGEIHVEAEGDVTINKYMAGGGGGFSGNYLDMDGKGIIARFEAAETLTTGDVCRLDSSGQMAKADAVAEALCNNMMAMALDAGNAGDTCRFLLSGYADVEGFTAGAILYVGLGGGFTDTRPSSSGSIVRVLGYALSPTQIFYDPDTTWIEVN